MNAGLKCTGGLFSWTLLEYWTHRELGHQLNTPLRDQHLEHHRHPELGSSPRWALLATILLLPGEPFLIGLVAGYYVYTWIHHSKHHSADTNEHLHHHGQPDTNYGVTTQLWDAVFKTLTS